MNNNDFFELATKILSGQETPEDRNLHLFLMKNEEYGKFFIWYKSKWEEKQTSSGRNFNYSRGLELLRTKINAVEHKSPKFSTKEFQLGKRIWQIAASVVILLGLGYLSYSLINNTSNQQPQNIALVTKITERGERVRIELPDGSIVYMNSESEISYPERFDKKERKVYIKGEAFFEVVREEKHPFTVRTGKIKTTVLGTKFNVLSKPDNVSVTLETGKVKVSMDNVGDEFFLAPGEQFSFDIARGITKKTKVNTGLFTEWRNGTLQFNEINFSKAIKQLENWYDVEIECNSEELLNRNIRGKYANEELKMVLEDLEFMFDFNYEFVNDSAIIINSK